MAEKVLRLILGDQLNLKHSWFRRPDPDKSFVMMEVRQETDYAHHHIQKIVAFLAAMRSFAKALEAKGHRVIYLRLDDPGNSQSISKNISALVREHRFDRFDYMLPDEYRLDHQLSQLAIDLSIPSTRYDTEHFLTQRYDLRDFFKGRKIYLMESFYRHMRRTFSILMDRDRPTSGRWNYDTENRRPLDASVRIPRPLRFRHNVVPLLRMIEGQGVDTIGSVDPENFPWPRDRGEALQSLRSFLRRCLRSFGTYQDAMSSRHETLFHSRLSFALNTKMLSPMEVVNRTLKYWQANRQKVDIAQVEGFIRQIIGWREFMRGVYWARMPGYRKNNYFGHKGHLPSYYWHGKTNMNCMKHALGQSLSQAYAHHIQRLMITGNFALLAGVDPDEVDDWYLGIYIDAIEWVEITNTRGMSQFADGGLVATKPYVSSASYINKMSDYCDTCSYDHSLRYGELACPFNSLYWDFLMRHRSKLRKNPRMSIMYRALDMMRPTEKQAIKTQAQLYRDNLDYL